MAITSVTPFLWFDGLDEVLDSYERVLGDIGRTATQTLPDGATQLAEIRIAGQHAILMNGGPDHPHTDAFSFYVEVDGGQEELDRIWDGFLAEGGTEVACGWLTDRFGMSWQITPVELMPAVTNPDPELQRYAFEHMMQMTRIIIADLTP